MVAKLSSNIKKDIYKWMVTILTGLFMFVVLYVYKGYNIDQVPSLSGHSLFSRAVTHAIATSLVFYVCEFHIRKYFRLTSPIKHFFWIAGEVMVGINVAFLLFNYFWQWTEFYWSSYSMFLYEYPLVVVFPILISQLFAQLYKKPVPSLSDYVVIASENGKNNFKVKPEHLLYLKSADNYVEIFHLSNGQVSKHLLRKSLKELDEEHSSNTFLVRCHRSYMVNPGNVDHIQSNNKGTKLSVLGISIPVSKKYISNFPRISQQRFDELTS